MTYYQSTMESTTSMSPCLGLVARANAVRYTYTNTVGGKETKTAELTEEDPVWVSVRHLHMKDAIDTLMRDFTKFTQEHAGFHA